TGHTDVDLLRKLLTDGADAAVAEVVDIIDLPLAGMKFDQILDNRHDIVARQRRLILRHVEAEAIVYAIAADLAEIVSLRVEEELFDKGTCGLQVGCLTTSELAIDRLQGVLLAPGNILVDRPEDHRILCLDVLGVNRHLL